MKENKNPVGKDGVFVVLVFGFGIPYPNGAFAHKHIISIANTEYVSIGQCKTILVSQNELLRKS